MLFHSAFSSKFLFGARYQWHFTLMFLVDDINKITLATTDFCVKVCFWFKSSTANISSWKNICSDQTREKIKCSTQREKNRLQRMTRKKNVFHMGHCSNGLRLVLFKPNDDIFKGINQKNSQKKCDEKKHSETR